MAQLVFGQFSMQGFFWVGRVVIVVAVCFIFYIRRKCMVLCYIILDTKNVIQAAHILHEDPERMQGRGSE